MIALDTNVLAVGDAGGMNGSEVGDRQDYTD